MPAQLELRNISVGFGDRLVLQDVSFSLARGQIGCLTGPSGCGKTTLLRTIAGFETPIEGQVEIHGVVVTRNNWRLAPERRRVGMVFQDYALFPNLTVRGNIEFGLQRTPRGATDDRVDELLVLVGLTEAAEAYPHQISGGQQQRVALARAMAPRPEILLLDEPFSSIDAELREQLAQEVRDILRKEDTTAIVVTHNQYEAFALADQIGVIESGRLMQWNSGYELYHRPENRFVADFIGRGVFLPGTVLDEHTIQTDLGDIEGCVPEGCRVKTRVDVLVRPDDVTIDERSLTRAVVVGKTFQGPTFQYTLSLTEGTRILCVAPSHLDFQIGDEIGIRLDAKHLVAFPRRIKGSKTSATPELESTASP